MSAFVVATKRHDACWIEGMHHRKDTLLFLAGAGAILLAEAVTVVLSVQVAASAHDPWALALAGAILAFWSLVLVCAFVAVARHLLLAGVDCACDRLDAARTSAHVGLLSAAPMLDLLSRSLYRNNRALAELRELLLAGVANGRGGAPVPDGARLMRAAGLASGLLRNGTAELRLVDKLDDWLVDARARHETVRNCATELRDALERVPAEIAAKAPEPAADPVFGYGLAPEAMAAGDGGFADLPEPLKARLRGAAPLDLEGGAPECN